MPNFFVVKIDGIIDIKIDMYGVQKMLKLESFLAFIFIFNAIAGSAGLRAFRLRLFPLKPFWTKGLGEIHLCTRGSAPFSKRDKSLLYNSVRWTLSSLNNSPCRRLRLGRTVRVLTTHFVGLRQSALLLSLSYIAGWLSKMGWTPTAKSGWSRLVGSPLDGGRPHRKRMPGGITPFPFSSFQHGCWNGDLMVISNFAWGEIWI